MDSKPEILDPEGLQVFNKEAFDMLPREVHVQAQASWHALPAEAYGDATKTPDEIVLIPKRFDTPATLEYLGLETQVGARLHGFWASGNGNLSESPVVHGARVSRPRKAE